MHLLLNLLYLAVLAALSPWLIYKALTTGKYRRGLACKLTGNVPLHSGSRPVAWFHGVSVGEVHLLRQVIAAFRDRHPDWDCVVSTTTDTGFEEARKHFPDLRIIWWPFDFSWAVRRALRHIQPRLVVLAEGEIWPNFLRAARQQGVAVAVINGRLSPRSARRYQLLSRLVRPALGCVDLFLVQNEDYASCFRSVGVRDERLGITGSVKFDGVASARDNPRTQELGRLLGISADDLVWIAGSTQTPEEEVVLDIFRQAKRRHGNLRLLIVPRQRERLDEVARLLEKSGLPFVRRSQLASPSPRDAIILVDTIGELGALWGLADVAFVGGSLDGRRGGQNMIEPAAYGAAVVFGPHVWNFKDIAARLLSSGAAVQAADAAELDVLVERLLADAGERDRLGTQARAFVQRQQGATERTMIHLDRLLAAKPSQSAAA